MKPKIDLPPILPDFQNLLTDYLICPERLPIHEYERNQEFWPREPNVAELFDYGQNTTCGTTLKVQRDFNTGKITEFCEVPINQIGLNAKNSMSLNRAPAPSTENVRGDPTNYPFWPGGFPDPILNIPESESKTEFTKFLTVPPGFSKGLCFEDDGCTVIDENTSTPNEMKQLEVSEDTVDLMNVIQQEEIFLELWKDTKSETITTDNSVQEIKSTIDVDDSNIIPSEADIPILNISKTNENQNKNKNTEWAMMIDINQSVDDFHERVPEMAHKYPFELDPFQKQAILKLEENCDVFVAAHTSAGKTVVAEYAIALSQKHKTRTIYTSPIKALSNQKYRDFKKTFQDVGLITGDFQINQTGVCLIMTTEILRSMLYCGSEVIRDLEYVIFDEVHYINDAERGHVWEEVLIMLPDHVRIVLLSATVPNTMEFASWLGMTKKRKFYVISTLYRPVPLQHYLYTGNGGKSRDERFLLIDSKGNFRMEGLLEATSALNARKKSAANYMLHKDKIKQEARALIGLIDHLNRHELLPVVAFTFSRAMCDGIAVSLRSVDLTTEKEKSKIHSFYEQCIKRLKSPDQKLPQIINMKEILKNGIGVHHSGILPIIKEIVEMLFQNGLVKILFATETFAMGVNMPARTVVFNSIEKFDGTEKRLLKPAEYIQMAGRAGRRGKDTTGTVIIRCSDTTILDVKILKEVMQGKPQKLESQFRLTYSMLLSLFRAESFSVETMMSHSFCEVKHVTKADQLKVELNSKQAELTAELAKEFSEHLHLLTKFYNVASEYIQILKEVQPKLMQQPRIIKDLTPGRVLLISYKDHYKKLGILLSLKKDKKKYYKVLVLSNKNSVNHETKREMQDDWYRMLSFTHEEIFQPEGVPGHEVLDVSCLDITLTTKSIKIDCDLVIKDWEKRQIPRFRNDPPGQTCQQAIQELAKLINNFQNDFIITDYHIAQIDLCQQLSYLTSKKAELKSILHYTKIANFEEQFLTVFRRKYLEETVENLKFLLSSRSLSLYPDYLCRIQILKQLRYIDEENRVQMKGRVACEMGMNELLITELVFRNTLTSLQPAEVAALLSALVFQVRSTKDQNVDTDNLPPGLICGMKEMNDIHFEIKQLEISQNVKCLEEDLNFGLVEVVYEWAKEKPFADIMCLTNVQEGIIVRCIQQLNETLKDVREAARIIGDPVLKSKMEDASNAIKRDIVFAASLYTQREAANIGV